jgi:hypothetical protein
MGSDSPRPRSTPWSNDRCSQSLGQHRSRRRGRTGRLGSFPGRPRRVPRKAGRDPAYAGCTRPARGAKARRTSWPTPCTSAGREGRAWGACTSSALPASPLTPMRPPLPARCQRARWHLPRAQVIAATRESGGSLPRTHDPLPPAAAPPAARSLPSSAGPRSRSGAGCWSAPRRAGARPP